MNEIRTLLDGLPPTQKAYVYARSKGGSREQAFRDSGLGKSTYYTLPKEQQERLEAAAAEIQTNHLLQAEPALIEATVKAVGVLVALLEAKSEFVKLQAATAILDRTMGKPTERVDVTSGGATLKMYAVVSPDDWDKE